MALFSFLISAYPYVGLMVFGFFVGNLATTIEGKLTIFDKLVIILTSAILASLWPILLIKAFLDG